MKLLVVGGGGREHAIIRSLKKNPEVTEIFACPGNGGMAAEATCVNIGATDIEKIVAFAVEMPSTMQWLLPMIRWFWAALMLWKKRAFPALVPVPMLLLLKAVRYSLRI